MLVKLIIKVMDGSNISVIVDGDSIPSTYLSELNPDIEFSINCIAKEFNIHEAYIEPVLTFFGTENSLPQIYYTIICPKEFLNEKAVSQLRNNFKRLSEQDRLAIRQSFSILPY